MITELNPLPPFDESYPTDINNLSQVVGNSSLSYYDPALTSRATLWVDGVPSGLSNSPNSSAWKINDKSEVLLVEDGEFFLWKNGVSVNLNTVIQGIQSAIDINDKSQILGTLVSDGSTSSYFIYDLNTNTLVTLPPIPREGQNIYDTF